MSTSNTRDALDLAGVDEQRIGMTFEINGTRHQFELEPWTTLLDLLRERAGLTGTRKGCDHGQCGACTALVNGQRINTCLALAAVYDGSTITTIEGLARAVKNGQESDDALHPMQQAFIDHDAFQCGYCTPGQICSAVGMLAEGHVDTRDDIRELMSGNLCRCGAYVNIVNAIAEVAQLNAAPTSERAAGDRKDGGAE